MVGKLQPPREDGADYETGQTFLHRLFGYRGVVLFPWMARVYDRDLPNRTRPAKGGRQTEEDNNTSSGSEDDKSKNWPDNIQGGPPGKGKEVKGCTHTYYQVESLL